MFRFEKLQPPIIFLKKIHLYYYFNHLLTLVFGCCHSNSYGTKQNVKFISPVIVSVENPCFERPTWKRDKKPLGWDGQLPRACFLIEASQDYLWWWGWEKAWINRTVICQGRWLFRYVFPQHMKWNDQKQTESQTQNNEVWIAVLVNPIHFPDEVIKWSGLKCQSLLIDLTKLTTLSSYNQKSFTSMTNALSVS